MTHKAPKSIALVALAWLASTTLSHANAFDDGVAALNKGDHAKAAQLYEKACQGGNAKGCTGLGLMYYEGQGVRQDSAKAAQLYEKGCQGGDALGCNNLGVMYAFGQGVRQNRAKAKEYYGKACDLGNQKGCGAYALLNR